MTPFREERVRNLKTYLGRHYNGEATSERVPVNMLEVAVQIYRRNLVTANPSVRVRTDKKALRPTARKFQLAITKVLNEIDFQESMNTIVFDALFGIGVAKIGITDKALGEMRGYLHDGGYPFMDAVDLDDLVLDMNSKHWEGMQFVGNRYELPYEEAMESDVFEFKNKPSPKPQQPYNEYGEMKVSSIGSKSGYGTATYTRAKDVLELWDIYMPYEKKVFTFNCDDRGVPMMDSPIREVDWKGPEVGPYIPLSLGDVSGNLMPLPPIANLVDLNDALNRTFRKTVRQADRQKTVTLVAAGSDDDGERILNSSDGDMIRVDRPEATREARFGGVDQVNLAYSVQLRQLFDFMGGNLSAMGGLSAMADTVGQEEIIKASSSQKIQDMQSHVILFAQRAVSAISSWIWYDPVRNFDLVDSLPETGFEIPLKFKPKDRKESEFIEMNFEISPSSMRESSPEQKLAILSNTISNFLVPLTPNLQAQGLTVDAASFIRQIAELTNMPDIESLIMPVGSMGEADEIKANQSGQSETPDNTTRRYVRENISTGGTQESRDAATVQALMGNAMTPGQEQMMNQPAPRPSMG
tara:strand:+ start:3402 stop:5150 length:1749 start_codon:yes stop_codon:yes gene_type:complete